METLEHDASAIALGKLGLPPDVATEVSRILAGVGENTSVFMTGSIVEGFGNAHSDVDLYLVTDSGQPKQTTAIGMRRSRYVDCEYFPARTWQRLAERIAAFRWADLASLRDAEIDRYYRLAAGAALRVTPLFQPTFTLLNRAIACDILGKSALRRAREHQGWAALLLATRDARGADLTLRQGAVWLATAELALHGEGYPPLKWFGEKAARRHGRGSLAFERIVSECIRPDGSLDERLTRLRERTNVPAGLAEFLGSQAAELAAGVRVVEAGAQVLFVHQHFGVVGVAGQVGAALGRLAQQGWRHVAEDLGHQLGLAFDDALCGLWCAASPLRISGHLVTKVGT